MTAVRKAIGSNNNDIVEADPAANTEPARWNLYGRDGDDTLIDAVGLTQLYGGNGRDLFVFGMDGERDYIRDFDATEDRIDLSALGVREYRQISTVPGYYADMLAFSFAGEFFLLEDVRWEALSAENFIFSDPTQPLPDSMRAVAPFSPLVLPSGGPIDGIGHSGNNRLTGNEDRNVLDGLEGHDTLYGLAGNDVLRDGAGKDILLGGEGRDIFRMSADGVADYLNDFETGIDRIDVSAWGVTRFAEIDISYLESQGHSGRLREAELRIDGEITLIRAESGFLGNLDARDFIFAPSVTGTDGRDRLEGTATDDWITDGAGKDNLFGRGGQDTFVMAADGVADSIKDFWDGDRIDVSAWGATSFDDLSIRGHHSGKAIIRYADEILGVRAVTGDAVDLLDAEDFVFF